MNITVIVPKNNLCISWREVLGNPYRFGLHPAMLLGEYQSLHPVRIKDQSGKSSIKILANIAFNQDYVYEWLRVLFINKLQIKSKQQLLEIVEQAWEYYETNY